MKFKVKTCIIAATFTAITYFGSADNVEAGNGWRWAKPLNQKPGSVLYTSNLKTRRQTTSRHSTSRRSHHSRTYFQTQITAPAHYPHVTVQSPVVTIHSTPTTQVARQPIPANRVIHSQTRVLQPSTTVPSMLDGWLVQDLP